MGMEVMCREGEGEEEGLNTILFGRMHVYGMHNGDWVIGTVCLLKEKRKQKRGEEIKTCEREAQITLKSITLALRPQFSPTSQKHPQPSFLPVSIESVKNGPTAPPRA